MVECVVTRRAWFDGKIAEPGTVVILPKPDAQYAISIGRVARVVRDPVADESVASPEAQAPETVPAPRHRRSKAAK